MQGIPAGLVLTSRVHLCSCCDDGGLYSCEDILVDERMSFLDDFVQMQLTAGARPYLAPAQRPDFSSEAQLGTSARFSTRSLP
jgi:hypothetical protein